MTTTQKTEDIVLRHYQWDINPCGLPTTPDDVSNIVTGYKSESPAPKQSRPKPGNVRISPAAFPRQSREERQYGIEVLPKARDYSYWCPSTSQLQTLYKYDKVVNTGLTMSVTESHFPDPDWALALRLKVADLKVNIGEDVAEFGETVKMLHSFAVGAKTAWSLYRGKLPKKVRRYITPCAIPAAVLTANFGVKPLVSTLVSSVGELSARIEKPYYKRVSATVKGSDTYGEDVYETSIGARCFVEVTHNGAGFTGGNPLSLAWELIPFSFVVDWGIGVGDYLSSLSATQGLNIVGISYATKRKATLVRSDVYHSGATRERLDRLQYESFERGVSTSMPFPRMPKIEFKHSVQTLANAVSLLWSVNKACKR